MPTVNLNIPIPLPRWLFDRLRRFRDVCERRRFGGRRRNLLGDRDVEWSFIAAELPPAPGQAMDFGNGGACLGLMAAERGFQVLAVDLGPVDWPYVHPNLTFQQGDLLMMDMPSEHFDLIINCSAVEHVGLAGRYGVEVSQTDGDLRAMEVLRRSLKTSGRMLLTVPVGRDAVFVPMCRVYGERRLPRLLHGFAVRREIYWQKNTDNHWVPCSREEALRFEAHADHRNSLRNVYALGCFVLHRDDAP